MIRTLTVLALAAFTIGACTPGSTNDDTSAPASAPESRETTGAAPAGNDSPANEGDDPPEPEATREMVRFSTSDSAIEMTTSLRGGGTRPLLQWSAVEGASFYSVTVYTPSRSPYWSSLVDTTEIYVAGVLQRDEALAGPEVAAGMYWTVTAFDDELELIAVSDARPIDP